jgi:hypothetical protein
MNRCTTGPRVPTARELWILVLAAVFVTYWVVMAVVAAKNIADRHGEQPFAPATAGTPTVYEEGP